MASRDLIVYFRGPFETRLEMWEGANELRIKKKVQILSIRFRHGSWYLFYRRPNMGEVS